MKLLLPFMALIGVIVGFILNSFKEFLINRPRLKTGINESVGKFNYYSIYQNSYGEVINTRALPHNGHYLELSVTLDVFNIGKTDTAVKNLGILVSANRQCVHFDPELKISGIINNHYSFNVKSGSITTLDVKLRIDNEEETNFLFNKNISLLPDEKEHLLFTIILTDIYNKKHKVEVEPLGFLAAE